MLEKVLAIFFVPVLSVMVYVSGYSYLDGFYSHFSISVSELSFSVQDVLIHFIPAFSQAIQTSWFWLLLAGMSAVTLGVFRWRTARSTDDVLESTASLMVTSVIVLILYIFLNASRFGESVAEEALSTANPLSINEIPERAISPILEMQDAMLFHLLTTETTIYAVIGVGERSERWTVRIPRDSLTSVVYLD